MFQVNRPLFDILNASEVAQLMILNDDNMFRVRLPFDELSFSLYTD